MSLPAMQNLGTVAALGFISPDEYAMTLLKRGWIEINQDLADLFSKQDQNGQGRSFP